MSLVIEDGARFGDSVLVCIYNAISRHVKQAVIRWKYSF